MVASTIHLLPLATINARVGKIVKELGALLHLAEPTPEDIHKLRRNTKKLRAWLRLVDGSRKADRRLRDTAAVYSAARDAHVCQQTLQRLPLRAGININEATNVVFPACLQALRDAAPAEQQTLNKRELDKAGKLVATLKPDLRDAKDGKRLQKGLRAAWRKAHRLLEKIRVEHSIDDVHRFRRRVKYLCYQLELVVQRRNGETRAMHKQLEQLGTSLGDFHDLDVLQHLLHTLAGGSEPGSALLEELAVVDVLCEQEKARGLASCMDLADRCFQRNLFRLPVPD